MKRVRGSAITWAVCILSLSVTATLWAADWPAYRHDSARSGVTTEQLKAPLHLQWIHASRHPCPAWPEPGKEMHRMPFDYGYQVAVANGLVYFGSSADDKVYALDAATGQERWSFFTGAPVRFAPVVSGDRVFVASDDGRLYCLSAAEGELLWKMRGGPRDDQLFGNERLISRWPLRSGVLVEDGTVYFAAGMWPSEGVYVYAVRAADGQIIWKNDSSGSIYMKLPHPGAEAIAGVAPQGDLLLSGDILLVPTGRSIPAAFDRRTGRFLYYRPAQDLRHGGTWVMVAQGLFFCESHPGGPDIDVRLGEAPPAPGDGLRVWDSRTGRARLTIGRKHRAVASDDTLYVSGNGSLTAYDLKALLGGAKREQCVRWETPCDRTYELILAGQAVLAAGRGKATMFGADKGEVLWTGEVDGQARGLAVAEGRLLVSTTTGQIVCFGPEQVANPPTVAAKVVTAPYPDDELTKACAARAERILKETGIEEGYCLDFGAGDGRLAYELARRSKLTIYGIEPDAQKVAAARRALDAAGLYGVRVTIAQGSLAKLPHPSYFANLIVSGQGFPTGLQDRSAQELYRVLRPCGGVAYLAAPPLGKGASAQELQRWLRDAEVPAAEISAAPGGVTKIVRGKLPGAGDWTHQYADGGRSFCSPDQRVRWPLRLLWFGKPGPARIVSRHLRTSAPVSVNGRLFITGENCVIAVDAYNGRELWSTDLPRVGIRGVSSIGGNLVADQDSVYLAMGGVCFRLDAATGVIKHMYRLPVRTERYSLDQPQEFRLKVDEKHSGTVTLRKTAAGLEVSLVTQDPKATNPHREDRPQDGDSWELFFDFRPSDRRGGLYGPGAFQTIVVPATVEQTSPSWKPGAGPKHPAFGLTGTMSDTGTQTTVRLSWDEIGKLAGKQPADFAFGVALNSTDDGKKRADKFYKFANRDGYRLTYGWASFVLDPRRAAQPAGDADLLAAEQAVGLTWGYLSWFDDLVFGSLGIGKESQYIFALDKETGELRWIHQVEEAVIHNAIAMGEGRIFYVDRTSAQSAARRKRRGEPVTQKCALVALDATTGQTAWKVEQDVGAPTELAFSRGLVLATGGGTMAAYAAQDGKKLWSRPARPQRPPVIVGNTIYGQPYAYDLQTGEQKMRTHPLTGAQVPWTFNRAYGCGGVSAAPTMLFFRSGTHGFYDLAGDSGIHNFAGVRPGCWINIIAASGLVLIPEADSACTCAYNYQTSVALVPTSRNEDWSVFSAVTGRGRASHLAVNLGAPGDRRDDKGAIWLGFPRPSFPAAVPVALVTEMPLDAGYYRHNSDDILITGTKRPWLYASGCAGLRSGTFHLVLHEPVVALPTPQPPKIDGVLDDPCWDGQEPLTLTDGKQNREPRMSCLLRQDANALYLAFRCEAAKQDGKPVPWTRNARGEDASVWGDDSWELFLTDRKRAFYVQLGVSASGARFDGRYDYRKRPNMDRKWNGTWTSAVSVGPEVWSSEVAVPWETLSALGLNKDQVRVNIRATNRTGIGPAEVQLRYPGARGFGRCEYFADVSFEKLPQAEVKPYTVRLHFAELEDVKPGQRVFDVKLQGRVVLKDLDVVKEAGGRNIALIKEVKGIEAGEVLKIELIPKAKQLTPLSVPIISALELLEE